MLGVEIMAAGGRRITGDQLFDEKEFFRRQPDRALVVRRQQVDKATWCFFAPHRRRQADRWQVVGNFFKDSSNCEVSRAICPNGSTQDGTDDERRCRHQDAKAVASEASPTEVTIVAAGENAAYASIATPTVDRTMTNGRGSVAAGAWRRAFASGRPSSSRCARSTRTSAGEGVAGRRATRCVVISPMIHGS